VDLALLGARLVLAAVFVTAGAAKLADPPGSRRALADFGIPASLAAPVATVLPFAELATAAALIPTASARWGALAALFLLLAFGAGIAVNLARGRKPDCHCFGQLHSAPAGWSTLARNAVLSAVAAFVVLEGWDDSGDSAVGWLGDLEPAVLAGLIAGAVIACVSSLAGWILLQLFRQQGRLLVRVDALEDALAQVGIAVPEPAGPQAGGLPAGAPAPDLELQTVEGETLTLGSLLAPEKPLMLFFTDPGCAPCNALLPELARWQRERAEELTIALVSGGRPEDNRAQMDEHGVSRILIQEDREATEAYRIPGTPSAVLVRPDGLIGSPVAAGEHAIRALLARTLGLPLPSIVQVPGQAAGAAPAAPREREIGEPAPALKLPDLGGETVDLEDFQGGRTLLLFWSPGCGFCRQMLQDLKAWEGDPPEGAPRLLVVSTGAVEDNRAMELRSRVVLDQTWETAREFGARGTPTAVLVGEDGRIGSGLAVGASAVLELAGADGDRHAGSPT
jgi:peroxiredoxin